MTRYAEGYEDISQGEIDALTRDDLLAIATDGGTRRLVRCTYGPDECSLSPGPGGHIVSAAVDDLVPVDEAEHEVRTP